MQGKVLTGIYNAAHEKKNHHESSSSEPSLSNVKGSNSSTSDVQPSKNIFE
jgi:hypothetical protein